MAHSAPLSVVIITFNEEANIGRCLLAASTIADELLVVDSGSTDSTVAIAESLGARVVFHPFEGHIQQKNWAKSQAKHAYILSLDADEVLSPELTSALLEQKKAGFPFPCSVNRLTWYCGQWLYHGGFNPDWKLRLWHKEAGLWTGINPHDSFKLHQPERVLKLNGRLLHYSIPDLNWHLAQVNRFTDIAAQELFNKGVKPSLIKLYLAPGFTFVQHYLLKAGFLDGFHGFTAAKVSALYAYLKYAKLKMLYHNSIIS